RHLYPLPIHSGRQVNSPHFSADFADKKHSTPRLRATAQGIVHPCNTQRGDANACALLTTDRVFP
ncbi:hypothetical protein, partial [Serratia sp. ME43]|uniref:hypothetical protein n=1 Tax=Serratia sp. ME43 TaxID=2744256 RepID=UPI001C7139D1